MRSFWIFGLPGGGGGGLVAKSCPTLCDSMDCSPPGSSVLGDSPDKNTGVGCHAPLQGFPDPGIKPVSLTSTCTGRGSLPLVPPGKPSYPPERTNPPDTVILDWPPELQDNTLLLL